MSLSMHDTEYDKEKIYSNYLNIINGVNFTLREVDILSCISNDLKEDKRIANFLSIAPKTVSTHIRNIMQKLNVNSKEGVINFINQSKNTDLLKNYYISIQIESEFLECLNKIKHITNKDDIFLDIRNKIDANLAESEILQRLKKHLILAGIKLLPNNSNNIQLKSLYIDIPYNDDCIISISISNTAENKNINLKNKDNYYFFMLELLKYIIDDDSNIQLNEAVEGFEKKYNELLNPKAINRTKNFDSLKPSTIITPKIINVLTITALLILSILSIVFFYKKVLFSPHQKKNFIHSDLIIPQNALLERPDIISKIKKNLDSKNNKETECVPFTGIVGIGGSGKTTIARWFAKYVSQANIVWELNAETKYTLLNSFNDLAYKLANTTLELKNELKIIEQIQNAEIKEKRLLSFVQEELKKRDSWLLIYDNIENFNTIEHLFPQNTTQWGNNGAVIFTTRNENITDTAFIREEDIIRIDELSDEEKFTLFSKILYQGFSEKHTKERIDNLNLFLKEIPSFPLEVSVAAYYIKNYGDTLNNYLDLIKHNSEEFNKTQSRVLKEATQYNKTRYGILSSTIEQLSKHNKIYKELFFLISILDSQNIPIDILQKYYNLRTHNKDCNLNYKTLEDVGKFLYKLKKHGLLTQKIQKHDIESSPQTISTHRIIQKIGNAYSMNAFSEKDTKLFIEIATNALKDYYQELNGDKNKQKIIELIPHFELAINKIESIPLEEQYKNQFISELHLVLGEIYFKWASDIKRARNHFVESLNIDKKHSILSKINKIRLLNNLGKLNEITLNLKEALKYSSMSLELSKNIEGFEEEIADTLESIGGIYAKLGDFKKGESALNNALDIIKKVQSSSSSKKILAEIYSQFSELYMTNYMHKKYTDTTTHYQKKALLLLPGGLEIFYPNKPIPENVSCDVAQHRRSYGRTMLYSCEDYNAALTWLNDAKYIAENKCPENLHLNGRIHASLGLAYLKQNKLMGARDSFNKAISLVSEALGYECYLDKTIRAEILIRLGKYEDAYRDVRDIDSINEGNNLTKLIFITSKYHAAFAQVKLNNNKKSIEHFVEFIQKAQDFCRAFLEKEEYDLLVKQNVFNTTPYIEKSALSDIKTYLHNSLKIFLSVFGPNHSFIKNYIEPNYLSVVVA